jgi:hypothetical protein
MVRAAEGRYMTGELRTERIAGMSVSAQGHARIERRSRRAKILLGA